MQQEQMLVPSVVNPGQWYDWKLTTSECNEHAWLCAYTFGYRKPNYPVPATIGPCVIWPKVVMILAADDYHQKIVNSWY